MFRDSRQRHRMWPGQMRDASIATRQMLQNVSPGRISQRGKCAVQCSGRIFNHLVKYLTEPLANANKIFTSAALAAKSIFQPHRLDHTIEPVSKLLSTPFIASWRNRYGVRKTLPV